MKIEKSMGPLANAGQSKPARGRKASDGQDTKKDVKDSVDLAASGPSHSVNPVASYDEAVNIAKGMDFGKAADAHKFGEAATDIIRLL
jgi:hypothetical protein